MLSPIQETSSPFVDEHVIEDATEGLLETNATLFFSPAARYTIMPRTLYGGLPRAWWVKVFVRLGLMGDADKVALYGTASPSHLGVAGEEEDDDVDGDDDEEEDDEDEDEGGDVTTNTNTTAVAGLGLGVEADDAGGGGRREGGTWKAAPPLKRGRALRSARVFR